MSETKPCIACSEDIRSSAKLCKHCNTRQDDKSFVGADQGDEDFDPVAHWSQGNAKSRGDSTKKSGFIYAAVLLGAVAIVGVYLSYAQSFSSSSPQSNQGSANSSGSSDSSGGSGSSESSGSSSAPDETEATENSEPMPQVSDDVLRDCIAYQSNFDATSDYRDFLWYEGQDYLVGNPTVHSSSSFSAAWDEVFVELDQTGAISWPIFLGELAVICYEQADYSLSLP
jgi:hypothetical protein